MVSELIWKRLMTKAAREGMLLPCTSWCLEACTCSLCCTPSHVARSTSSSSAAPMCHDGALACQGCLKNSVEASAEATVHSLVRTAGHNDHLDLQDTAVVRSHPLSFLIGQL